MKRILTLLAVMAVVLSSCNKNEIAPNEKSACADLKVDVTISYPGDRTKALVKENWANGDQIKIWYGTTTGDTPDLVLQYDGTNWEKVGTPTTPSASGTLKAVYSDNVAVAANGISYTYSGETLSFNINNWVFLTEVQVVVSGINGDKAAQYTLACDKFAPFTGYSVGTDAITASAGTINTAVTGISNDDGAAFVFATADYSQVSTDFIFSLTDNTSGSAVVKKYAPANPLPKNTSVIKAIKIADSKFVAFTPVSSVAEANALIGTNDDNAKSVDLTAATITAGDVADDGTIHLVLKTTSPSDMVSFILPAIPGGIDCNGWTIRCEQGCSTEKVNVEASDGSSITILAPDSHVILTGGSYDKITARTGYNTFVVPSGVTIADLKVEQGAVEIRGTVNALTVSPLPGKNVLFRSCEGLSQTVFNKIKKDSDYNYIDPSYSAVQNTDGTWDIVLRSIDVPVTSVSLSGFPEGNTISVGASVTLTATIAPADATIRGLIWKSSNNAVATVDQDGKVTGVAAGTATITVVSVEGSKKDSCTITVKESSQDGNERMEWEDLGDGGFH